MASNGFVLKKKGSSVTITSWLVGNIDADLDDDLDDVVSIIIVPEATSSC